MLKTGGKGGFTGRKNMYEERHGSSQRCHYVLLGRIPALDYRMPSLSLPIGYLKLTQATYLRLYSFPGDLAVVKGRV